MTEEIAPMAEDAGPEAPGILGVVAGQGADPQRIVTHCLDRGWQLFLVAFEGQTSPELVDGLPHAWMRLGAGGKALKTLKKEKVSAVVLAGSFERPSLRDLRPDLWTATFLARNGHKILDDEAGLMAAVIRELEDKEGIRVLSIDEVLARS